MTEYAKININIDEKVRDAFRDLALAKNLSQAELFRRMVEKETEANKELLQKWKALEDLRNK